jgi:hypothetical protein
MIVRAIKVQHNRETDRIVITFEIDPASWRNMDRSARAAGHVDTLSYVEATINDAFLDDEAAKGETRGAPDANEPARADEDLDDGIPF